MCTQRASLQEIRRPVFKNITPETLDRSSLLHTHYLRRSLTPEILLGSSEDLFTVAFYYNMQFDILEYLKHLRGQEITNVSYNVMKSYLRSRTREEIVDFTSSGGVCMSVLRGELYRIGGFSLSEDADLLDEYVIFGAITIHENYTSNFDTVFDMFVGQYPRLVGLLDVANRKVVDALVRNIRATYPIIVESGVVYDILDELDINTLSPGRIVRLFSGERLVKADKKTKAALAVKMLLKIADLETFLKCAISVSEDTNTFSAVLDTVLGRAGDYFGAGGEDTECVRLSAAFCYVVFYHTGTDPLGAGHAVGGVVRDFIESDTGEFVGDGGLRSIKEELGSGAPCFRRVAELYAKYAETIRKCVPRIEDVLDLPEKFFLLSLDAIGTESAALLREFHTNLMHDRIKEKVSRVIDREILVRYLIKRHIWFKTDMGGHVGMMDDRYKMLYAENNLEWASENMGELRKIGISRQLYSRLRRSGHGACLTDADKRPSSGLLLRGKSACTDEHAKTENAKNVVFKWGGLHTGEDALSRTKKAGCDGGEGAKKPRAGINGLLAVLFDCIRTGSTDYVDTFREIETDADYLYVMGSLFEWARETSYLENLGTMLDDTVLFYAIKYGEFKGIVARIVQKCGDCKLLANVTSSLGYSDILDVISDYPDQSGPVSEGIRIAHEKYSHAEGVACVHIRNADMYHALRGKIRRDGGVAETASVVERLVFSTRNDEVLVGVKALSCLRDRSFSLDHLLASTSDSILEAATEHIQQGAHNEAILEVVFTRGVLDTVSANLIKRLDIDRVGPADLNRIYSLFYIAPLVYVECEIHQYGFALNESMVVELIGAMSTIYDRALFDRIARIIGDFCFGDACFSSMIQRLDTKNIFFKNWMLESLAKMGSMSLPYFVSLCFFIANEDDLDVVRKAIDVLRQICARPGCSTDQMRGVILKWSENKRLARLTRRVYPLAAADPGRYLRLLGECPDGDEVRMLRNVHRVDME